MFFLNELAIILTSVADFGDIAPVNNEDITVVSFRDYLVPNFHVNYKSTVRVHSFQRKHYSLNEICVISCKVEYNL